MQIICDDEVFNFYFLGILFEFVLVEVCVKYLNDKIGQINMVLGINLLLFDWYLDGVIEVDVDVLCDGKDVFVCGIMEYIEEVGIYFGDSVCFLFLFLLLDDMIDELKWQMWVMVLVFEVGGLMNV